MKPQLRLSGIKSQKDDETAENISRNFDHFVKQIYIDPYRITRLDEIGRGSQGIVYLVKVAPEPGVFALKEITCFDPEEIRHLKNELNIINQCQHPNIVRLYGMNVTEQKVQIVMEYMDFGTLKNLVRVRGALPEMIVRIIAAQIMEGLSYMQQGQEKIAHRDLKPGNILLNMKGDVKIADFGIARKVIGTVGEMTTNVGTQCYMSPERLRGSPYNSKCDIWSFGIILFECALGKFPFADEINKRELYNYQYYDFLVGMKRLDFPNEFSPEMKDFLSKCLNIRPEDRPRASDLLLHPFIEKARAVPKELFVKYLESVKAFILNKLPISRDKDKTKTK